MYIRKQARGLRKQVRRLQSTLTAGPEQPPSPQAIPPPLTFKLQTILFKPNHLDATEWGGVAYVIFCVLSGNGFFSKCGFEL